MSYAEMQTLINQRVYLPSDGLLIECVVKNVKAAYGRLRVQVIPMSGRGETWVDASRVRLISSGKPGDLGPCYAPSTPLEEAK